MTILFDKSPQGCCNDFKFCPSTRQPALDKGTCTSQRMVLKTENEKAVSCTMFLLQEINYSLTIKIHILCS